LPALNLKSEKYGEIEIALEAIFFLKKNGKDQVTVGRKERIGYDRKGKDLQFIVLLFSSSIEQISQEDNCLRRMVKL